MSATDRLRVVLLSGSETERSTFLALGSGPEALIDPLACGSWPEWSAGNAPVPDAVVVTDDLLPLIEDMPWPRSDVPVILLTTGDEASSGAEAAAGTLAGTLQRDPRGAHLALLPGLVSSVIGHRRASHHLRLLSQAVATVSEGILAVDLDGTVLYANRAFGEIYGWPRREIIGHPVRGLWEDPLEFDRLWETVRAGKIDGRLEEEYFHKRRNETTFPANLVLSMLRDERGADAAALMVLRPLGEDPRLEDALSRISNLDALTGLPNLARFQEALDGEWRRAARQGTPLAVILLDVDYFDRYNELHGRRAADHCLQLVSQELCWRLRRAGDLAARVGGEEFALLLPGLDRSRAEVFAGGLLRAVQELELPHGGSACAGVVTMSAGVATTVPAHESSPSTFLALAGAALAEAKAAGRNRAVIREFGP